MARGAGADGLRIDLQRIALDQPQPAFRCLHQIGQRHDAPAVPLDRDDGGGIAVEQRPRQTAGAGTDFDHRTPERSPADRAIRPVRLRSSRKFCPSALRAPRSNRAMTSRRGGSFVDPAHP